MASTRSRLAYYFAPVLVVLAACSGKPEQAPQQSAAPAPAQSAVVVEAVPVTPVAAAPVAATPAPAAQAEPSPAQQPVVAATTPVAAAPSALDADLARIKALGNLGQLPAEQQVAYDNTVAATGTPEEQAAAKARIAAREKQLAAQQAAQTQQRGYVITNERPKPEKSPLKQAGETAQDIRKLTGFIPGFRR